MASEVRCSLPHWRPLDPHNTLIVLFRVVPSQGYIDKLIDSDMTYLGSVFLCCGTRDMSLAYARWVHWVG